MKIECVAEEYGKNLHDYVSCCGKNQQLMMKAVDDESTQLFTWQRKLHVHVSGRE